MEQWTGSIGKEVRQGYVGPPCLFKFYAEYIMRNPRLNEAQTGIKIARRNVRTSDMQRTPPLWQKGQETKEPLDKGGGGEWKIWLKTQHSNSEGHGIWFCHFITNSWGSGNSDRLYFLGLQNHCRWWPQAWN